MCSNFAFELISLCFVPWQHSLDYIHNPDEPKKRWKLLKNYIELVETNSFHPNVPVNFGLLFHFQPFLPLASVVCGYRHRIKCKYLWERWFLHSNGLSHDETGINMKSINRHKLLHRFCATSSSDVREKAETGKMDGLVCIYIVIGEAYGGMFTENFVRIPCKYVSISHSLQRHPPNDDVQMSWNSV